MARLLKFYTGEKGQVGFILYPGERPLILFAGPVPQVSAVVFVEVKQGRTHLKNPLRRWIVRILREINPGLVL